MSKSQPSNIAASVRQRLLNHARATQTEYNLVEVRYAIERLLYRLSVSNHRDSPELGISQLDLPESTG